MESSAGGASAAFTWDPAQYAAFAAQRARPFHDLVARVRAPSPRVVVDLGCGPGALTRTLAERWPDAQVVGLDDSPEMLERARASLAEPGASANLRFERADAAAWSPGPDVDVVVSNAMLQWIPEHPDLIRRWLRQLPPGAWFAAQVPRSHDQPSHAALAELIREPLFAPALAGIATTDTVREPGCYARLLLEAGWEADVWEALYQQVLPGEDPIPAWTSGAALRPALQALARWDAEHHAAEGAGLLEHFTDRYRAAMRAAYPPVAGAAAPDGGPLTLFPFRRLFLVGRRPGE